MTRDVARLTDRTFDLLVVGGGIYGLIVAADAAQRGLSVALIDRDDFGAGASANHLRTIHGGLRYLQTLDFARARESIRERRTLARIAPHMLRPMPYALPLRRGARRGPLLMRLGLLLEQLVASDRNRDLPESHRLPAGRVLPRAQALDLFPTLASQDGAAFALWYDYETVEADRLTLSWALLAVGHGAQLANYVEATSLIVEGRRINGVRAVDRRTGAALEIAARVTVNATGGWLDTWLGDARAPTSTPMLRALNLVTSLPGGDVAIGGHAPEGRALFMVPWRGRALFGTWESRTVYTGGPVADEDAVESFLAELRVAFPTSRLAREHVTLVHAGVVPAVLRRGGEVRLEGQQRVRDHGFGANVRHGLLSVAGTKYTTARATAEYVTDLVLQKLDKPVVASRTAITSLPGSDLGGRSSRDARESSGPFENVLPDVRAQLMAAYGPAAQRVERLAGYPGMNERLIDDPPVIAAQVVWAVRHEMALTLVDVVRRRTAIGAFAHPGAPVAARVAELMATELSWSQERVREELEALRGAYHGDVAPQPASPEHQRAPAR
jgi:glycerol-3-phosphate dehydrogenase